MTNAYYSLFAILAIIIHLIINHGYFRDKIDTKDLRGYKSFLYVSFLYFVADAAWGLLNGLGYNELLYLDTFLYFIAMALSVVFCCKGIASFLHLHNRIGKTLSTCGILFAGGEIILLVINHFTPIFFSIDETGTYHTYPMRHVALLIQVLMFIGITTMSFVVLHKRKSVKYNRNLPVFFFGLTMTLTLIAQLLFPMLPFYTIGLLVGTLIVHVFIYNEDMRFQLERFEELTKKQQEEHDKLQKQKVEVDTAFGVIKALCNDFHTIWVADKADMKIKMVRAPKESAIQVALQVALKSDNCDDAMKFYVDHFICEEDQERMARMVNTKAVLEQLEKTDFFTIDFMRRGTTSEREYIQLVFANIPPTDGRQQMVFGFRDVNDIMRREHALREEILQAKNIAEAANAAKTSFLFNMSHDIRTPMNAIIGFRDLLEKSQDDPVKRADYLQKIDESSRVLLSIINNVLEMARIEKGVLVLDETAWSIEQLGDAIYSIFENMMTEKGITFTHSVNVQHHYIYCDTTKLREIFINIISNAYKYTKKGGSVHMQLDELPSEREGYARYRTAISDTGIGMSEDFLPHIFEEFSRESNSTHSKIEGTGLGMPIVKRLIDFLEGTIEVQSKKDEGSTFIVTFDHRIAEKTELVQTEDKHTEDGFEGKRILLAEDNELNAEIAIAILSEAGLSIDHAIDGQDCIEKLLKADAGHYDLILMDIQMPNLDGYEATKAIRALDDPERSQIPIIAMTANAFEEDKRNALRVGMNAHLAKPIDVGQLFKTLSKVL